ncbi:TetR family transcriptional regulator [Actinomyces johnsonii]|uniref:TetR family transcriptional regulator n=1 Tax=Actinomyces johnsonii TaxID=544581 RepID=A0A508A3H9_9ACTO|nr:TetR/AcrR family transcriptional regulator [Actinomyces johnsonii]KAA8743129.1 TetR family transcriptional regulator [Actinomyces johnsonii]TQD44479.1 TetR family transcriptional regulator [Actinomyces johnsonii]
MPSRTDKRPRLRMDPAERRELILSAASRAFASRPYEEVSLAEIAEEAQASEALVHKYFVGKAGIYAQVLQGAVDELAERTRQADAALPEGSSARDRVRASVLTYLDFIAERSPGWMAYQILAGHEPGEAARVRQEAREAAVRALAEVVGGSRGHRDDFAFWGYLGFLDDACLRWVRAGCPDDQRHSLIDAALGCLEGALGDWRA